MELWSLMDANRNFTGKVIKRGQTIDVDCYHLVVFAFIKNINGKLLIAKRSGNKTHAHTWEIPAGSSILQESSMDAIIREVKEEVGIDLHPDSGRVIKSFSRHGDFAYIADIWLFDQFISDNEICCSPQEVEVAKFVDIVELRDIINSGMFMVGMPEVIDCIESL